MDRESLGRFFSSATMKALSASGEMQSLLAPHPREVTLFSSDIGHFSEICHATVPEQIAFCLGEYLQAVSDAIFSHEGTIQTIVGDRIAALFNAPIQIEEHERVAVEAAIAVQRAVHNIANSWMRDYCQTGIGLTWGTPLVGFVGPSHHMDYIAIGPEVATLRTLERAAEPGQILLSHPLYERVEHQFEFRQVEGLEAGGAPVYELLY